jgi:hypothetical protein
MTRRSVLAILLVAVLAAGSVGVLAAVALSPAPSPSPIGDVGPSPIPTTTATPSPVPTATPAPTPTPSPTPSPTPTPVPTPVLVAAPMTGRLVSPDAAQRHPIAVMIDDQADARPQSGLSAASVVWQAPAEGGIPRYMAIFQDQVPTAVGPVRSARYYFIAWAAEWKAVYAHVGGSPQALSTLASQGNGKLVYNADQFRWGGTYFQRIKERFAPHNVYTTGKLLWKMAGRVGAKDGAMKAAWQFAPDAPLEERPSGGTITVSYLANKITYTYDRATNTYLRTVTGEKKQTDAANDERIAPKNVVVMRMVFGPLNDSNPAKHRLEAKIVGSGKAWIATNGKTIVGTWKKTSLTSPTRFYDADGNQVTLTVGQTFVQVMQTTSPVSVKDGKVPVPGPSGSPAAGSSVAPG